MNLEPAGARGTGDDHRSVESSPRWIAAVPFLLMISLLAGTPLVLPLAGRHMGLGPTDFILVVVAFLSPWWWRTRPPVTVATVTAYAFVAWCLASAVFWSVDMRRSVLGTGELLKAVLTFLVCYNAFALSQRELFPRVLRLFNGILAVQLVWGLWSMVNEFGALSFFGLKDAVVTPIGQSNFIAIFFEFGIVYELLTRRKGWLAFGLLQFAALLLTLSRGALVALAITLTVGSMVALVTHGQRKAAAVLIGALATAGLVLLATPLGQFIVQAFDIIDRSATARMSLWSAALTAVSHAPLTGIGFGAFESIGGIRDTHSTFFELLSETGVIGLTLFSLAAGAIIAASLVRAWDGRVGEWARRENMALGLALFGVLTHSMIEPFFLNRSAIWTAYVLAWMVAVSGSAKRQTETPDVDLPLRGRSGIAPPMSSAS